jgi:hypothetical protein
MAKHALSRSLAQEISRRRAEEYVRLFAQYLRTPQSDHPKVLRTMEAVLSLVPNRAVFSSELVDVVRGPILDLDDVTKMRWLLRHQVHEIKHHPRPAA